MRPTADSTTAEGAVHTPERRTGMDPDKGPDPGAPVLAVRPTFNARAREDSVRDTVPSALRFDLAIDPDTAPGRVRTTAVIVAIAEIVAIAVRAVGVVPVPKAPAVPGASVAATDRPVRVGGVDRRTAARVGTSVPVGTSIPVVRVRVRVSRGVPVDRPDLGSVAVARPVPSTGIAIGIRTGAPERPAVPGCLMRPPDGVVRAIARRCRVRRKAGRNGHPRRPERGASPMPHR